MRVRFEITKDNEIRYISHLDYSRAIERAIRRSGLPTFYSEGFNPHMKMSFASALAVGVTSETEYMDLELADGNIIENIVTLLSLQLPPGIRLLRAKQIEQGQAKLMAVVNLASYKVNMSLPENFALLAEAAQDFAKLNTINIIRHSPKGNKEIDIKSYVDVIDVSLGEDGLVIKFTVRITPTGSAKPSEVLQAFSNHFKLNLLVDEALICRTGLFTVKDNECYTPFDLVKAT